MEKTATEAGVQIIAGRHQSCRERQVDGVFINTTGVGNIPTE